MSENNNRLDNVRIIVASRERASYWIKDVLQIIKPSDHVLIIDSDEPAPPKYEKVIKEELIDCNKAAYINIKDIDVNPVEYIEYRLNSEISKLKQSTRNISLYILDNFYFDELVDSFDGRVRNIGKHLPIEDKSKYNSSKYRQSSIDSSNNINNVNKKKNASSEFSDALNDFTNDFFNDANTVIDNSEKENKEPNNKKKKDNSNQSNKEENKSDNTTKTKKKDLSEQGNNSKGEQNIKDVKNNTKKQDDNNDQNDKKENNKDNTTQQQKTKEEENNNKPQGNDIEDNESLEDTKAKLVLKLYDRLKKNFSKYVDEVSEKEFFNILFLLLKATDYDDFIKSAKTAHPNLRLQPDLGGEDGKIFKGFQAEANYYLKICDDVYKFDVFGDSDEESEEKK